MAHWVCDSVDPVQAIVPYRLLVPSRLPADLELHWVVVSQLADASSRRGEALTAVTIAYRGDRRSLTLVQGPVRDSVGSVVLLLPDPATVPPEAERGVATIQGVSGGWLRGDWLGRPTDDRSPLEAPGIRWVEDDVRVSWETEHMRYAIYASDWDDVAELLAIADALIVLDPRGSIDLDP